MSPDRRTMTITVDSVEERRERAAENLAAQLGPEVLQAALAKKGFNLDEIADFYIDVFRDKNRSDSSRMKAAKALMTLVDDTVDRHTQRIATRETVRGSFDRGNDDGDRAKLVLNESRHTSPLPDSLRGGIIDPLPPNTHTENDRVQRHTQEVQARPQGGQPPSPLDATPG